MPSHSWLTGLPKLPGSLKWKRGGLKYPGGVLEVMSVGVSGGEVREIEMVVATNILQKKSDYYNNNELYNNSTASL